MFCPNSPCPAPPKGHRLHLMTLAVGGYMVRSTALKNLFWLQQEGCTAGQQEKKLQGPQWSWETVVAWPGRGMKGHTGDKSGVGRIGCGQRLRWHQACHLALPLTEVGEQRKEPLEAGEQPVGPATPGTFLCPQVQTPHRELYLQVQHPTM